MNFESPKRPPSVLFQEVSGQPGQPSDLSSQDGPQPERPRNSAFARRAANVVIVAFFLLLPFVYIFNFQHKFGSSLIGSDHLNSAPAATPSTPAPGSSAGKAAPVAPFSLPAPPSAPQETAASSPSSGEGANASAPAASVDALAALTPPGATAPATTAATPSVPDLWLAVQHGDVDSEVALARLYLSGTGVSKSCEQARILFSAAAKKGNADAQRELDNLPAQGCP